MYVLKKDQKCTPVYPLPRLRKWISPATSESSDGLSLIACCLSPRYHYPESHNYPLIFHFSFITLYVSLNNVYVPFKKCMQLLRNVCKWPDTYCMHSSMTFLQYYFWDLATLVPIVGLVHFHCHSLSILMFISSRVISRVVVFFLWWMLLL